MSIGGIFDLPFEEQIAFLRQKIDLPSDAWDAIWAAAHDRAFVVAGAQTADLLRDLHAAVIESIESGEGLSLFREHFFDTVRERGWSGWTGEGTESGEAWRTRVIWETNAITSYSAGRLKQLEEGGFSHYVYRHSHLSAAPRDEHLAWDGVVLPAADPFWQTHTPPNGFGCRCRVVGIRDPADAARVGGDPSLALPDGWDTVDPDTGAMPGVPPGWAYQPGARTGDDLEAFINDRLITYPLAIAEALRAGLAARTPAPDLSNKE